MLGERGPRVPVVEIDYIHPGEVSAAFMASVMRMRDYEMVRTQMLMPVRERRARSGAIGRARNQMVTVFLASESEYMLWIDADMGFPRDAVHKMLAVAEPTERPIVGGLCFAHRTEGFDEETNAEHFGTIPTLQVFDEHDDGTIHGFHIVKDYPRDQAVRIHATGAAFLLIHRGVLEAMREKYGDEWFSPIKHPVRPEFFGEDTSFFLRAHEMGLPVFAHTGVRTSHDKGGIFLTEQTWDIQEANRSMLEEMGALAAA